MIQRHTMATVMAAIVFTLLGTVCAAENTEPETATTLISSDLKSDWVLGAPQGTVVPLSIVPITGQPFTQAFQITILKQADYNYSIQLGTKTIAPVRKGDICVCTFSVRNADRTHPDFLATTQAMFERTQSPGNVSLREGVTFDSNWRKVVVPFVAGADFSAGEAKLNFRLGFAPTTVEIGGVSLVDYGTSKPLAEFQGTPITYAGREPSAPWRTEALKRIETLRKGNLTVRVIDDKRHPVKNATVQAALTQRAFSFGSAITDEMVSGPRAQTDDAQRWRTEFVKHFDTATIGLLTWRWWETPKLKAGTMADTEWVKTSGIRDVHGAHLVWTRWDHTPAEVEKQYRDTAKTDPARATRELQAAILTHIHDVVPAMRGIVTTWNVINEEIENHEMAEEAGGIPAMIEWFKAAHTDDPNATLIINDYDILEKGGVDTARQDKYFGLIKALKDGGAPIQGIGIQCHFDSLLTPPIRIRAILDRFAVFGLPIYITEFDTKLRDAALQSDYTRDFLLAIYSHPSVAGFTMWDFWDGVAWLGDAPLYEKDWTLKPSGKAFFDLVDGDWNTKATGITSKTGTFTTHGTLGDYSLTVTTPDGRTAQSKAKLIHSGTDITVQLSLKH